MSVIRAAARFLASRRVAVRLLIAFTVYAAVASAIPQGAPDAPDVVEWVAEYPTFAPLVSALGLFSAFTHPVFVIIAAWLSLATAACALERTRWAVRQSARLWAPASEAIDPLKSRHDAAVSCDQALTEDEALALSTEALQSLGLRTTAAGSLVTGRSRVVGLLGSPIFHWALAALFVVISLGQLTRSEGLMGVVVGYAKPDVATSYGFLNTGPWHGGLSGLTVAIPRMERDLVVKDVSFGPTPYVELWDGDRPLGGRYVRSNAPLRAGGLLIHMAGYGRAAVLEVTGGGAQETAEVFLDADEDAPGSVLPVELTLAEGSVAQQPVVVTTAETDDPAVEVTWSAGGGTDSVVLRENESAEIGALTVTARRLAMYARLSVVDDWSVWPIYVLFGLALLGISLAVLAPTRSAVVLVERTEGTLQVFVRSRHMRSDPDWPATVRTAVAASLAREEEPS